MLARKLSLRFEMVRFLALPELRDAHGKRRTYDQPCSGGNPCTKSEVGCP